MPWHSALRLGSPSWVYPADALANVEKLAGLVQDVEWLIFEVTGGLPTPETGAALVRLAADYGHSYTVHLPLDLQLATDDSTTRRQSIEMARAVIGATRAVAPWAYVVHLLGEGPSEIWGPWHERAAESLAALAEEAGALDLLAIENVPAYPAAHLLPLVERLPLSFCLDVGHLLRQGADPLPLLTAHLSRTRAVHLHGYDGQRDHRDLGAMDQGLLHHLLDALWQRRYGGVVTIECFAERPFFDSWDLVQGLWRRVQEES